MIGTWKNANHSSSGAFHLIIKNKNTMEGKSLSESVFNKTIEVGANWTAVRVEVSPRERLGLLLNINKSKIFEKFKNEAFPKNGNVT